MNGDIGFFDHLTAYQNHLAHAILDDGFEQYYLVDHEITFIEIIDVCKETSSLNDGCFCEPEVGLVEPCKGFDDPLYQGKN